MDYDTTKYLIWAVVLGAVFFLVGCPELAVSGIAHQKIH
jgi:hypothetical protein